MRNQKVSHLKEGFGSRSPGLQHNGQDGEDDDLDGRTAGVPVRPTDTILQQQIFLIWCEIFSVLVREHSSMAPSRGASHWSGEI